MFNNIKSIGGKLIEDQTLRGDGDTSFKFGESNKALSDYCVAMGYKSIAGLLGYYIDSVYIEQNIIYLSNKICNVKIDNIDRSDAQFITPEYEQGDIISIIVTENDNHLYNYITIESIENNVITYSGSLKESDFGTLSDSDNNSYNAVLFVYNKPDIGEIIIHDTCASIGASNKAIGYSSFAEGRGNVAIGWYAHAEGRNTKAGYSSHAEGISTSAMGIYSHSEGETTQASGRSSHAEAKQTKAIGDYSHAEGIRSQAIGSNSHAEGQDTVANSSASHVEGVESRSEAKASHAEGIQTIASGYGSHTEGYKSNASKDYAHAEGQSTAADGVNSHAEGLSTISSGTASHSEGSGTTASGDYSHSEGSTTIASAYASHAEGYKSTASAGYSHAEGRETTASAQNSHSEGYLTKASGSNAHAEGRSTIAKGLTSHAEGGYTVANGDFQHVQGKYNIADNISKYAHIVGNGTADTERSNAHTLDWNGNAWFAGDIRTGDEFGGTIYAKNIMLIDNATMTHELTSDTINDIYNEINNICNSQKYEVIKQIDHINMSEYKTSHIFMDDETQEIIYLNKEDGHFGDGLYGSTYISFNYILSGYIQCNFTDESIDEFTIELSLFQYDQYSQPFHAVHTFRKNDYNSLTFKIPYSFYPSQIDVVNYYNDSIELFINSSLYGINIIYGDNSKIPPEGVELSGDISFSFAGRPYIVSDRYQDFI